MPGAWSPVEEEDLIRLYPTAPRREVLLALPGRNWKAIGIKASKLGLTRSKEAAYDLECKRRMREAALRKFRETPGLREQLSRRIKELHRTGVLKSPLGPMGNGQPQPVYESLARVFLEPLGFEHQHCVSSGSVGPPYKLDFGHPGLKIDVEIDGKQHRESRIHERDRERDRHLASLGWRVVRIRNEDITAVLLDVLAGRLPK